MFNEGSLLKDCRPGGHTRFVVLLGSGLCTSPCAGYLTTYAIPLQVNELGGGGQKQSIYEGLEHFIFYLLRKVLRKKKIVSFCLN